MGKLEGKVAFITGAARGQGRSHAIRLAQEGADIIAVDICAQIDSVPYPMATPDDLAETVKQVEALDRRIVAAAGRRPRRRTRLQGGLRRRASPSSARSTSCWPTRASRRWRLNEEPRQCLAGRDRRQPDRRVQHGRDRDPVHDRAGQGGAIVLTSSTAGINGIGGPTRGGLGYTAAKHGVVGLMRSYANTLAPHSIRVNSVHPTGVNTPMVVNDAMQEFLAQDPSLSNAMANALPVGMVEPVDISNAIVWLVSDDARYVTGVTLPVDAGFTNKK